MFLNGLQLLVYIWTFIVSSIYGFFLFSACVYLLSEFLFGVEAYGFSEMVAWFSATPTEVKTAILTSSVTVLGFLMAFATAAYSWKSQIRAQLKLQASEELGNYFVKFSSIVNEFISHVDQVVDVYKQVEESPHGGAMFMVRHVRSNGVSAIEKRMLISKLSLDIYSLDSRYSRVIQFLPGLEGRMSDSIQAIKNITADMWIQIPIELGSNNDELQSYVEQVDSEECRDFIRMAKSNLSVLAASQGAIRGALQSEFIGLSFWHVFYSFKNMKDMSRVFRGLRDDFKIMKK